VQRLQRDHRGHHISRHAGPTPTRREQIREHLIGEQLTTMRSQKPKDTARLQKMPSNRLRIQQLTLIIRSTLHPKIIPNHADQKTDRHAGLFRSLLVSCAIN